MTRLFWIAFIGLLLAPSAARAQSDEVVYYHTDAIGSVRMITNQAGVDIGRFDFTPFGQPFGTQPAETRRFGGKELDAETGLDYFGARYMRAQSGRFTSVDPVMNIDAALTDPQRWNRYSYVGNRPMKVVDPDGRDWVTLLFRAGRAAVTGGDVYSTVTGVVDSASIVFSTDARIGAGDRLKATGHLVAELSGATDILAGAKSLGVFARHTIGDAGSWWGRSETLADHVARHGADFGISNSDEYIHHGVEFLRTAQQKGLPTKIDSKGVIRVYDPSSNTFGAYNPDGTLRTLYKPDPAKHGYRDNWEYWVSMKGEVYR